MLKVLIVDDELGIRTLLSEILEDEGYQVFVAEDAQSAKLLVKEREFNLILLDIWMPDMDGISLLKEWSSLRTVHCPIIMMSGHATIETAMEATSFGAVDFLEKPISMQRLLDTCLNAIQQWEAKEKQKAKEQEKRAQNGLYQGWQPTCKPLNVTISELSEESKFCDHFILNDLPFRVGPDARLPIVEIPDLDFTVNFNIPLRDLRDNLERAYFKQVLKFHNGSVTQLAKHAGLERTHLYRKIHLLGLDLSKPKGTTKQEDSSARPALIQKKKSFES